MRPWLQLLVLSLLGTLGACVDVVGYSLAIAKVAHMYSSIAYSNCDAGIKKWIDSGKEQAIMASGFEMEKRYYDQTADASAYIAVDHNSKKVIAAFRGTDSFINVIEDFGDYRTHYHQECKLHSEEEDGKQQTLGRTHEGFCAYYKSLDPFTFADDLHHLHKDYLDYEVIFTGHSLGGAVASLAATHFGLLYPNVDPLIYTFGEPRAGDISFVKKYEEAGVHGYRVVHHKDPIPHMSFACFGKDKMAKHCPVHASPEIHYQQEDMSDKAKFHVCDGGGSKGEDAICMRFPQEPSIHDHRVYFGIHTGGACQPDTPCHMNGNSEETNKGRKDGGKQQPRSKSKTKESRGRNNRAVRGMIA